jgi:hypothetical protein
MSVKRLSPQGLVNLRQEEHDDDDDNDEEGICM